MRRPLCPRHGKLGVLLGLCGYVYHGPKGYFGFAPRITPEEFKAAFTAAQGWGTIAQKRTGRTQTNTIDLRWGQLQVRALIFELPQEATMKTATAAVAGKKISVVSEQQGQRVVIALGEKVAIKAGQSMEITITC